MKDYMIDKFNSRYSTGNKGNKCFYNPPLSYFTNERPRRISLRGRRRLFLASFMPLIFLLGKEYQGITGGVKCIMLKVYLFKIFNNDSNDQIVTKL